MISQLETKVKVLDSTITDKEAVACAEIYNSFWINQKYQKYPSLDDKELPVNKLRLTVESVREALSSGELYIAALKGDEIATFLETKGICINESGIVIPDGSQDQYLEMAKAICRISPQDYLTLRMDRTCQNLGVNPNVLWLMSITSEKDYIGSKVGRDLVDFLIDAVLNQEIVGNPDLKSIRHILTRTPKNGSKKFHLYNGAVETGIVIKNDRAWYEHPDTEPTYYLINGDLKDLNSRINAARQRREK